MKDRPEITPKGGVQRNATGNIDYVSPISWSIFIGVWMLLSLLNDLLLMDVILKAGFIITCVLLVKTAEEQVGNIGLGNLPEK